MPLQQTYEQALEQLRAIFTQSPAQRLDIKKIIDGRDAVLARYQPIFNFATIGEMSEEAFRSFLYFENNQHWTGLFRQVNALCADMNLLRRALAVLLDESRPLAKRFDGAVGKVRGLGKGIATAILVVSDPNQYGVWNNTSEAALRALDLWVEAPRGSTLGEKYERINKQLNRLAADLGVDLWTLDAILWGILPEDEQPAVPTETERQRPLAGALPHPATETPTYTTAQGFGLERHLHDFLVDNWRQTTLGKEWNIYSEPGDDAAGYEFPTDVGRIDLLARHKSKSEWLIIELKRNQTSDETVGQVLRYMGWVQDKMAEKTDAVRGLIIAQDVDERLRYAVSALHNRNVGILTYEVDFHLKRL